MTIQARGAVPVRHLNGRPIIMNKYYVPSTDSTALYRGDFVGLVNAMDPKGEVAVVKALGATGDAPIGVVCGFEPDASNVYTGHYRPASTNCYVLVCDDPDVVFAIAEDADGGAVSQANIASHANADIALGAGNAYTGLSGHALDSNTATTSSAVLKILGAVADGTNAGAASGGAYLEVIIFEHALKAADSIT